MDLYRETTCRGGTPSGTVKLFCTPSPASSVPLGNSLLRYLREKEALEKGVLQVFTREKLIWEVSSLRNSVCDQRGQGPLATCFTVPEKQAAGALWSCPLPPSYEYCMARHRGLQLTTVIIKGLHLKSRSSWGSIHLLGWRGLHSLASRREGASFCLAASFCSAVATGRRARQASLPGPVCVQDRTPPSATFSSTQQVRDGHWAQCLPRAGA